MNPRRIEFFAYILGLIVLGLLYPRLKTSLSEPIFFGLVIGYLAAVRGIGYLVARQVSKSSSPAGGGDA
jgi:hypothetical protein